MSARTVLLALVACAAMLLIAVSAAHPHPGSIVRSPGRHHHRRHRWILVGPEARRRRRDHVTMGRHRKHSRGYHDDDDAAVSVRETDEAAADAINALFGPFSGQLVPVSPPRLPGHRPRTDITVRAKFC